MIKITPFGNQILIKPHEKKQVLVGEGGSLCEYGEVLAIGDAVEEVKVGDIIGHTIWGVNSLQINDEKHYLIPEDPRFVLAKLDLSEQLSTSL